MPLDRKPRRWVAFDGVAERKNFCDDPMEAGDYPNPLWKNMKKWGTAENCRNPTNQRSIWDFAGFWHCTLQFYWRRDRPFVVKFAKLLTSSERKGDRGVPTCVHVCPHVSRLGCAHKLMWRKCSWYQGYGCTDLSFRNLTISVLQEACSISSLDMRGWAMEGTWIKVPKNMLWYNLIWRNPNIFWLLVAMYFIYIQLY